MSKGRIPKAISVELGFLLSCFLLLSFCIAKCFSWKGSQRPRLTRREWTAWRDAQGARRNSHLPSAPRCHASSRVSSLAEQGRVGWQECHSQASRHWGRPKRAGVSALPRIGFPSTVGTRSGSSIGGVCLSLLRVFRGFGGRENKVETSMGCCFPTWKHFEMPRVDFLKKHLVLVATIPKRLHLESLGFKP